MYTTLCRFPLYHGQLQFADRQGEGDDTVVTTPPAKAGGFSGGAQSTDARERLQASVRALGGRQIADAIPWARVSPRNALNSGACHGAARSRAGLAAPSEASDRRTAHQQRRRRRFPCHLKEAVPAPRSLWMSKSEMTAWKRTCAWRVRACAG